MTQIVLWGISAGAASALLFSALASGKALSIALFYFAPLPILLVGILKNHMAGLVAAAGAAGALGVALGSWFLFAFLVAFGLPAYVLSYLALLARPAGNGQGERLEWYPTGKLVLAAALFAAVAVTCSIPVFGLDFETFRATMAASLERTLRLYSGTPPGEPVKLPTGEDARPWLELMPLIMPPSLAVFLMTMNLCNLWLAGRIARASGLLSRSWPEISALTYPNITPLALFGAIALAFMTNLIGLVASIFVATLLLAYVALGFCVIHAITRPLAWRGAILAAVWIAVLLFRWPILAVAIIGLADGIVDLRGRVARRGPPNLPTHRPPNE